MNARKKQQIGSLLFLLFLGGLLTLRVWRQLREDLLSAQLMATIKELHASAETNDDQNDQRESFLSQNRSNEVQVLRLLREGANPNTRDFATCPHTFWEELKFLMKRMSEHPSSAAPLPPSALAIAVQADNTVIVTALLKAGANDVDAVIEPKTGDYRYPLVNYAAYTGNLEIVQALCARKADIHKLSHNPNPSTDYFPDPSEELFVRPEQEPILHSVLRGVVEDAILKKQDAAPGTLGRRRRAEIFHLLLAQGAKYEPNSKEGYALLAVAADGDFLELTRELLAAGVLPNANPDWPDDPPPVTPLDSAVMTDDIPLVELLLCSGAATRDDRSEPPISFVHNVQMAKLLLKHGADIQAGAKRGKRKGDNRLNFACIAGDNEEVLFWIKLGIDVNTGREYNSPIAEAAEYGNVETVRLLLEHGAKVGPRSPGAEALWLALAESHFDSARLLLRYGADVNSENRFPLTEAVAQESAGMVLELLKRGANVNAGNGEALFAACDSCDEDLVKILLEHGANPTFRSEDGMTTIQAAKQSADPLEDADGIIALLKRYGAKR